MVVLDGIEIDIRTTDVLSHSSLCSARGTPAPLRALVPEVLGDVEARGLLKPAIAYDIHPIGAFEGIAPDAVQAYEGIELAAVVVTIGPALDAEVAEFFEAGRTSEGLLLDLIGNLALSEVRERATDAIAADARTRRLGLGGVSSPGDPRLDLSTQEAVLGLAGAARIGVTLTTSGMMVPLKSLSMVFCLGVGLTSRTGAEACRSCPSFDSCRYRQIADKAPEIGSEPSSLQEWSR